MVCIINIIYKDFLEILTRANYVLIYNYIRSQLHNKNTEVVYTIFELAS